MSLFSVDFAPLPVILTYLYTLLARRDARLVPLEDELPGVGPAPEAVVVHVEGVVVLPRQHPGKYLQCVCQTGRMRLEESCCSRRNLRA